MNFRQRRIARGRKEVSFLDSAPEQTGAPDLDTAEGAEPCRPCDSQCKKWGYTMMALLAIRTAAKDEISDVPQEMEVIR